jgi:uncharacterized protein YndB with AHSA1/START domain
MTPPSGLEPIKLSVDLPISQQGTWEYLLNPELRAKWWSNEVVLEGKHYGRFYIPWHDEEGNIVLTRGEVIDIYPPEHICFTWADPGWSVFTLVSLTIYPVKKGSRLDLLHSGWEHMRYHSRFELRRETAEDWAILLDRLAKAAGGV